MSCNGCSARIVRYSLVPKPRDRVPLRGGRRMPVSTRLRPGVPVWFSGMSYAGHGEFSRSEVIPASRPGNETVHRQFREAANEREVSGFKLALRAQIRPRLRAFGWTAAIGRHLRLFVRQG